jgi:4-hydroxy-tetrahydrodipicolinate synthase
MTTKTDLAGVVPALTTPFYADRRLAPDNLARHMQWAEGAGCDGVLLLGTTGEGPSLSVDERIAVLEAGRDHTGDMLFMAGTGCASLRDTIHLTRRAFELGADAVVVVPPFYYKRVTDDALVDTYHRLLDEAVPDDGLLILYHIPQMSGIGFSFEAIERLLGIDENRVAGIKDSSGDLAHGQALCREFPNLRVFMGDDKLLHAGLQAGAAGCITAGANVFAPLSAAVYRAYRSDGGDAAHFQSRLTAARTVLDSFKPFPASVKHLLAHQFGTSGWDVLLPLSPLSEPEQHALVAALAALKLPGEDFGWLNSDEA